MKRPKRTHPNPKKFEPHPRSRYPRFDPSNLYAWTNSPAMRCSCILWRKLQSLLHTLSSKSGRVPDEPCMRRWLPSIRRCSSASPGTDERWNAWHGSATKVTFFCKDPQSCPESRDISLKNEEEEHVLKCDSHIQKLRIYAKRISQAIRTHPRLSSETGSLSRARGDLSSTFKIWKAWTVSLWCSFLNLTRFFCRRLARSANQSVCCDKAQTEGVLRLLVQADAAKKLNPGFFCWKNWKIQDENAAIENGGARLATAHCCSTQRPVQQPLQRPMFVLTFF